MCLISTEQQIGHMYLSGVSLGVDVRPDTKKTRVL